MASGWIEQRTQQKDHHTLRIADKDPATGKRKVVFTATVIGPKLRAEAVLKDKLAEYHLGLMQMPTLTTVADLLRDWLDVCKTRLAATTVSGYEIAIRKHINPVLGRIKLSELQPLHLQRLYAKLLKQGLSERTVQWVHVVCGASLKQAVKWGIINRNPADMVDAPKPKKTQMRTIDAAEIPEFLQLMAKSVHGDIAQLALYTGLRRGELVALTWDDVDFERSCLYVRRNTVRVHKESITKEPKTDASRRTVVLPLVAVALLARLRATSAGAGLVFMRKGKPVLPSTVTSSFRCALIGTRFQGMRLHDMRHSHASLFLKGGGHFKVLQERLGHGSHSTTMDIYAHLVPEMQRESVRLFDKIVEDAYQNAYRPPEETRNEVEGETERPA